LRAIVGESWTDNGAARRHGCGELAERAALLHELGNTGDRIEEVGEPLPLPLRDLGPQRLDVGEVVVHRPRTETPARRHLGDARPQQAVVVAGEQRIDGRLAMQAPRSTRPSTAVTGAVCS
jgi:hypothetical protein